MTRKMKDSGVEWIGMIPDGWNMFSAFQIFSRVDCKNVGVKERNLLSLSYGRIKRKDIESADGLLPESFEGYNIIEAGDIVLRLTDLQNDQKSLRVGYSRERGIVTSAYLTIRNNSDNVPEYLYYYWHTFDICKGFYGLGAGVRQGLNWEGLKNLRIALPLPSVQNKIVKLLNKQCASIDDVIAKTTESIEEYKKLKQAVITEAVTKGVRGKRPMKESGIPWYGKIPSDVSVSKVGRHYDITLGKMLCDVPKSDDMVCIPYICAANVHFDGVDVSELKQMWFSPDEIELYKVQNGDLLIVEGGAGAGGCAIVQGIEGTIGIQNSIQIIRSKDAGDNRYLCYALQSLVKGGYMDIACNKATIPHFTKDKLSNSPYIVWSIEERCEIADYLDSKCAAIDTLISKKQQFIDELTAYKKSLIYEYVTGKKEVPT